MSAEIDFELIKQLHISELEQLNISYQPFKEIIIFLNFYFKTYFYILYILFDITSQVNYGYLY